MIRGQKNYSIEEILKLNRDIYQIPDDRLYTIDDLIFNYQKFLFLFQKNFKSKKSNQNLDIAAAWLLTLINRYHLNLEKKIWQRYSYKCPYCLEIPCICNENQKSSQKTGRPASRKPQNLDEWQEMFKKIYPDEIPENVFNHLLENLNQLIYFIRHFSRKKTKFGELEKTIIDHFVIILRLYNALGISFSQNFKSMFGNGCYDCHKTPCICNYFE